MNFVSKLMTITILTLLAGSVMAQSIPNQITVYSSANAGARIDTCKAVLDLYAEKHGAKINYQFFPGSHGVIAMEAMLRDQGLALLCSGPSESIFNVKQYPDRAKSHGQLTMVTMLAVGASSFYTGPNTSQADLPALLATNRPLKVGTHSSAQKFIGDVVFKNHAITWVNFGKPMDALPSLLDGSIDIYMSSGSYEALVRDGKIKTLGFINGSHDFVQGVDLTSKFPEASRLPLFLALTTNKNQDALIVTELNRRLQPIITSAEVKAKYSKMSQKPLPSTLEEANAIVKFYQSSLLNQ